MEDIRPYGIEEEEREREDEWPPELEAASLASIEEEVPFHIPRD